MSSIAATGLSQQMSPLQRLQDELTSEVSSGAISANDESALSSALTDIDSELKSQAPSAGSGSPPSPDAMKTKIDDLIANEVSNGKLTSAQADELKNVFAQAFKGGPGGPGGPHGHGGPGGPGQGGASASQSSSSDSSSSNILADFLKQLQDSQGNSSSYSAGGDSLISQLKSLVVNYQA